MNNAMELAAHVRGELNKAVVGQREALDQLLLVLLVGGHALVEGVPGLAKTLAVKALAHIFQLKFQRVQCTPDLMPADQEHQQQLIERFALPDNRFIQLAANVGSQLHRIVHPFFLSSFGARLSSRRLV